MCCLFLLLLSPIRLHHTFENYNIAAVAEVVALTNSSTIPHWYYHGVDVHCLIPVRYVVAEGVVEDTAYLQAVEVRRTARQHTVAALGRDAEDVAQRRAMLLGADVSGIMCADIDVYMMMIEDGIAETERIGAVLRTRSVVVFPDTGFEKMDEEELEVAGNSSHWQLRRRRRQKQLVPKQHTAADDCLVS